MVTNLEEGQWKWKVVDIVFIKEHHVFTAVFGVIWMDTGNQQ
jgi:hypothetical protein